MKAIFIIYNQAHTEKIEYMLDMLNIRGYSNWPEIKGRGTSDGDPHLGTHTWPEVNSGVMAVVKDEMVDIVLEKVRKIDEVNKEVGIRAFVMNVEKAY